ncbi:MULTISPECIES: hypothetical protein [unclassified Flavobacterium]|jgi:hypothetical protein|uniref:hypothetical protein n=1 Tax=unclassified Flavobacterium TaxID=196869 RepID=UPI0025BDF87C|nr:MULTISPECIES: hypothetical protein [unclassified Flavobacterium]
MKKIIILSFTLLVLFFYLDSKTYYYGFGNGFFSSKIPHRFEIYFAGSDFGNQGMILEENDMSLLIIHKNGSIFMDDTKKKIIIDKFLGYWFNDKIIIAKVKDKNNNNRYIQVYEEVTNNLYPKFICKEISYSHNEFGGLKYIDLDKSLNYFKKLKLIKNISFILCVLSLVYSIKVFYLRYKSKK